MDDNQVKMQKSRALLVEVETILRSVASPREALEQVIRALASNLERWNWVGIYLLCGDTLVLGPYIGKPTEHDRIKVGVGVCGSAVEQEKNMVVDDVTVCENYLACSVETRSEIVVLIRHEGRIVGQFDVDSDLPGKFGVDDEKFLEEIAPMISLFCAELVEQWSK